MVGFAGTGDIYNNVNQFKFKNLKLNYGFGARFSIDESENFNLRLDVGFRKEKLGFYLGIAEAF